jgi:hypothetical protein
MEQQKRPQIAHPGVFVCVRVSTNENACECVHVCVSVCMCARACKRVS